MAGSGAIAFIWVKAGPDFGGGHAVRAQAMAQALVARGIEPRIFADVRLKELEWSFAIEPLPAEPAATCSSIGASLAIVDLPHTAPADPGELGALRQAGAIVVTFDSTDPDAAESDVLVHLAALPAELPAARPSARLLLGPRYAVLRPQFADAARLAEISAKRQARAGVLPCRLLLAFGASDPAGLAPRLLEALEPRSLPIEIAVLVGPLVSGEIAAAIDDAAGRHGACRVIRNVADPLDLLAWADLAILGFGMLWLESLATGLPAVLWHPSEAHALVAARFRRHLAGDVAVDAGDASVDPERVVEQIARLCTEPAPRLRMGRAAALAVDGQGAGRVATTLAEMVAK